jgi:hypothetical protein
MTENEIGKVHARQVLTYSELKGLRLGFVLSFGASLVKDGIKRVVRGFSDETLCGFASWRETQSGFGPDFTAEAAPPHR